MSLVDKLKLPLKWEGPFQSHTLNPKDLPAVPGIYIWRRLLNIEALPTKYNCAESGSDLTGKRRSWLIEQLRKPTAVFRELRFTGGIRSGFIKVNQLTLGAAEPYRVNRTMTVDQVAHVVFEAQLAYGQTLYVGKAKSLARRIGDHLNGSTDFSKKRLPSIGLTMQDVSLTYCELEFLSDGRPDDDALLQDLEKHITVALDAPLSEQVG